MHRLHGQPQAPAGFALVVALTLMGFVLLLMVSLSMMTATFSASSATGKLQLAARQNAMVGLYAALGQLQTELGPDQRVSARADLTDGIANPYWTGVWDNDGTQRTWLVSGNNTANPFAYAADTDLTDGVELVSDGTNIVRAPRVEISDDSAAGAYAYWVGDEGVKAKASMASTGVVTNAALISPSAFGVEQMLGMDWYRSDDPLAGRLYENSQLELLESQWKAPEVAQGATTARFHDLTVYGYGVISDTREGGLRRDLAAGLESIATEPAGQIFGPVESAAISSDDPGGPLWQQLRSWANAVQPNGDLPVRGATDTQTGFYPVVTTFQVYFLPTYDPNDDTPSAADDNQVYLHVIPAIVLWNPYDRTLESSDYMIVAGRTYLDNLSLLDDGLLNAELSMSHKNLSTGEPETSVYSFPGLFMSQMVFNINNVELAPGEVAVYSANGNGLYSLADSSSANVLSKGYHEGSSLIAEDNRSGIVTLAKDTTTDEVLDAYSYELERQRVIGIRMYRTDVGGDREFLSESYYMHAFTSNTPPQAHMTDYDVENPLPLGASHPGVLDEQAIGVKYIRTFVDNDPTINPTYRTKWLANGNPRAATAGPNPILYSRNGYSTNSSVNFSYIGSLEIDGTNRSPGAGVGLSESSGIDEAVLFEVLESPENIYSIGELMHAPLFFWNDPTGAGSTDLDRIQQRQIYSNFDNMIPAYAVGNAQADPNISLDETYVNWSDFPAIQSRYFSFSGMHYDYSYLLNDALWDRYFFSSWESNGLPENSRMSVIDGSVLTGPNYLQSAESIMIDGAFNVNSTSVEAWKALLASFYGEQVQKADGSNANNANSSPILRFREPLGSALGNGDAEDDDAYVGYKALDADEIQDLAEAIVDLIKARGPFTSLAEFINRSLEDNANTPADDRLRGLLAQALLDADTNAALEAYAASTLPAASFSATASQGWRTENIPGWLSQADLLARLGSVLSVRSDTFRIRCYGEAKDPLSDQVVGTAWCEAIVQRFPDYIDATNVAYTPMDEDEATAAGLVALTQENQDFGRRFKIVAFRWLTPDEI